MNVVAYVFFGLGAVFTIIGNIGVLIFPDVYTRLQASSTCSTTAVFSILVGCMFASEWGPMTGKLLVITAFFFLTSPISAHIIGYFAWTREIIPWRHTFVRRSRSEQRDD